MSTEKNLSPQIEILHNVENDMHAYFTNLLKELKDEKIKKTIKQIRDEELKHIELVTELRSLLHEKLD